MICPESMVRRATIMLLGLAVASPLALGSPEIPGQPQTQPIALMGGTVHPVVGADIPEGTVLFVGGKIVAIGKEVTLPEGTQKIDITGKHVYPALFDSHTDLGLVEINSIRATIDHSESGLFNPNVKSWVAVNPDSEIIPVTRSNGVLLTLTTPSGRLLAGRSAVIQLDGWSFEDLTLRAEVGMHVYWPSSSARRGEEQGGTARPANASSVTALREFWESARKYQKAREAAPDLHPLDVRLEAMLPVLGGKLPIIVTADDARQIQTAVAFAIEQRAKLILHGGYDAPACADLLKQHDIPVIVAGTYRLPHRKSDPYDSAYTVPERLRQAGVTYCIASAGRFGASGVRNLPYQAANAVAFGLPADEALRAITLYPARILGVAERVGSLEPGKDATLFVSNGDPLDTESQVEAAYIQGRQVELNDRHKRLWHKYQAKP